MSSNFSRREFLTKLGVGALVVGGVSALAACGKSGGGDAGATCTDATGASKAQRDSLHYKDKSPHADKACSGCALYVAAEGGAPCGKCTLFASSSVAPAGYCDSWAKKA